MPLTILRHPADAALLDLAPLKGRTVGVIGFGNQGSAHARNLRDSGIQVIVGARNGAGRTAALAAGFEAASIDVASSRADLIIIALPDEVQPEVYVTAIAPNLRPGATLGFIHGFCIRFGWITPGPGVGIVLVAPKGPGTTLRQLFEQGRGLPCLFAVERESAAGESERLGLAWATGIGSHRAGVIRTTFAHETETDLFGEQVVLCGGMTQLMLAAFDTLVGAGYPPELAYLECCHELKQVTDLLYERGLTGANEAISNTAEFGAFDAGPRVVDASTRATMAAILTSIRSGEFAARLRADQGSGFPWFEAHRQALREHPIERAGETVRRLMPWLIASAQGSNPAESSEKH